MTGEPLAPAGYGVPTELGSIDPDDRQLVSLLLAQRRLNLILERLGDVEAKKSKDEFIRILLAWDEEHDRIKGTRKSDTLRKLVFKGKNDLIGQVRSNISGTHSWEEVFGALRDAEEAYKSTKGIRVVHSWFRKAVDKSDLIEPFVDLIPNSDFSSVVCGGIKFILRACTASKRFRDEAFELINQLPEKVEITGQYAELYRDDAQLQVASYKLFCHILSAIQSIIYWLTKDHTFEWLKPLMQQSTYNYTIKERIKELGLASAHVTEIVQLCNTRRLSKVSDGVGQIHQHTTWIMGVLKALVLRLTDNKGFSERQQFLDNRARQGLQEEPETTISQNELLLLLDPNATTVQIGHGRILQRVIRNGLAMDTEAQKRVEWLMANKSISRWFTSTKSRTLLVHGRGSLDRVSPMSFFCAMLVQSLTSIGSIILLSHFCGLEMPESDSHGSGGRKTSGLLKSLLIQLLAQWKTSTITCFDREFVDNLTLRQLAWIVR
ncbi:hypothetical protein J3F83DRAFT_769711 [Trichoderma novae-zelandiae]